MRVVSLVVEIFFDWWKEKSECMIDKSESESFQGDCEEKKVKIQALLGFSHISFYGYSLKGLRFLSSNALGIKEPIRPSTCRLANIQNRNPLNKGFKRISPW